MASARPENNIAIAAQNTQTNEAKVSLSAKAVSPASSALVGLSKATQVLDVGVSATPTDDAVVMEDDMHYVVPKTM